MAKKKTTSQAANAAMQIHTDSFVKGMVQDVNESFQTAGTWPHARNAVNNSTEGDVGTLENEASTKLCVEVPYDVIGQIHLYDDKWAIFTTDDINSEIGMFDESQCSYTKIVNDSVLAFDRNHLIKGAAKENYDCTWQLYWDDGKNPSRTLNIDDIPYKVTKTVVDDCVVETPTDKLDEDQIRLARLMDTPCITIEQGEVGTLLNGTYQVYIAYSVNGTRVSDYMAASNLQSIFFHENSVGSIEVNIEGLDTERFDEFELAVVTYINQQTSASTFGYYSTQTKRITIDSIDQRLVAIPLSMLLLRKPAYEKSDAMYTVTNYLLRVGVSDKFDFNYQPLANKIKANWVAVEYDADYYRDGGSNTGYMRDEQYAFFIRWIYNTGEKSSSYHIPGRQAFSGDRQLLAPDGTEIWGDTLQEKWSVYNTATVTSIQTENLPDGGKVVKRGKMGYWESSERYPDNKPVIWEDLCGKPIRHHKMPDDCIIPRHNEGGTKINVLGVEFTNIKPPVDNDGNLIPGIVGYEILRGSRKGNKSIIAKGLLNNMFEYSIPGKDGITGMYPNYPFNDLRPDPYLTKYFPEDGRLNQVKRNKNNEFAIDTYSKRHFTFHSPDTQFKHPFLSGSELRIYGDAVGSSEGQFIDPYKHPEHKMLGDSVMLIAVLLGLGNVIRGMSGETTRKVTFPKVAGGNITGAAGAAAGIAAAITEGGLQATGVNFLTKITSSDAASKLLKYGASVAFGGEYEETTTGSSYSELPPFLKLFSIVPAFLTFTQIGTDQALDLIYNMLGYKQYALQHIAHGKYDKFVCTTSGNKRRKLDKGIYLKNQNYSFDTDRSINNFMRSRTVALEVAKNIADPITPDTSKYTLGSRQFWDLDLKDVKDEVFNSTISSKYVGIKIQNENQYGQLDSIAQSLTSCAQILPSVYGVNSEFKTPVLFGGDIYITRYTEKNTMFFFNDWLAGKEFQDGEEYDYRQHINVPYPRYYANTQRYRFDNFVEGLSQSLFSLTGIKNLLTGFQKEDDVQDQIDTLPSDFHNLDRKTSPNGLFRAKGWFYLFNSGVKDFFVESEINCGYRDHDDKPTTRHYDDREYTDLQRIFRADEITAGNHFKYDFSLSAGYYFTTNVTMGNIQTRDYDPEISETCHTYYPNRLIYSLPQEQTLKVDNWRTFLVNNYQDFKSPLTAVKPIGDAGALIMLRRESPMFFAGNDTIQSTDGLEITIGDGGLFDSRQKIRNVVNTDASYEYGSCQNRLAISATPAGIFYVSQNQGKIFAYSNTLKDLTGAGMKWWFAKYLPYQIKEDFPEFDLVDNSVNGVAVSTIYDNRNAILYITKKDYKLRSEYKGKVEWIENNIFSVGNARVELGDSRFFEDASWTISYDVKSGAWISFHDWHPDVLLPGKNLFMSVKDKKIWKHNNRCDSFCNFYGKDYPFEVEQIINTGQMVSTIRSFEYQLECYQYKENCKDEFHILDANFDRAVVYNSEQVSGMLNLNISPKNDPQGILGYPKINVASIDILYSKEENKYRFNQFWDITKDRGEFSNVTRNVWDTQPNGYIRTLNNFNLDYTKDAHEHKKFRHYNNRLFLKKNVSGRTKMRLRLTNAKLNISHR